MYNIVVEFVRFLNIFSCTEGQCRGMQCFSGACIPSSLKQDLVSDCPGLTAEDEVQRCV